MNNKDEIVSAFAFKTGKDIEQLIKDTTNNLQERNRLLEGKILHFRQSLKETIDKVNPDTKIATIILQNYDEYFGISTSTEGKID